MDTITYAKPLEDYRVEVKTGGGISGIFDVKPYLNGSAFQELKNLAYFNQLTPIRHGIRWPHEQDFSSDTIIWDIQHS